MARIYPSNLRQLELNGENPNELETLKILQEKLPRDYQVFHSLNWRLEHAKASDFGEIDFAILSPTGKVILIEQKNGSVRETETGLIKQYGLKQKNVGDQIGRNLEKLQEKFTRQTGLNLFVDYLIYLPDYHVTNITAAAIDYSRIVDARSRDRLDKTIQQLAVTDHTVDPQLHDRVSRFFQHTLDLIPDVHAFIEQGEKHYTRLCGNFHKILMNLEMEPFRLVVEGVAGSGKSTIVQLFSERFRQQDKRVLVLCFNRALKERLRQIIHADCSVYTWHSLIDEFLKSRGSCLDYDAMMKQKDYWQTMLETMLEYTVDDAWKFDTLIVDEGQDFRPDWLEIAKLFLKDEHAIIWQQDSLQQLYHADSVDIEGAVKLTTYQNYRSPVCVIEFLEKYLPFKIEGANPYTGMGYRVTDYQDDTDQLEKLKTTLDELIKIGFDKEEIVILTCRGAKENLLKDKATIGRHTIGQYTGEYDSSGNQIFTEGDILFDTVRRYKGQQAPAVIVIEADPQNKFFENLLYCGATRATVRLEVLTPGFTETP